MSKHSTIHKSNNDDNGHDDGKDDGDDRDHNDVLGPPKSRWMRTMSLII